ncbi:phosphoethanolamine N-methyltransferase-like [Oscarella lobularis]|uniref:phosphoethanolamine N-methyltransferase-like n=1 Tax=Oscarella lobularis TaxID=121494 RepID=UPI0033144F02
MVRLAQERLASVDTCIAEKVKFQLSNVETVEFSAEGFDAVFWRSSLLHIPISRKEGVLKRMMKWLKPGGQFISMDHCLDGKVDDVEGFQKYLDLLGVEYLNVESYKKLLETVGLKEIFVKEDNAFYVRKTAEELASVEKAKSEILKLVPQETYQAQQDYWVDKRKWTEVGAMNHVYFVAHK